MKILIIIHNFIIQLYISYIFYYFLLNIEKEKIDIKKKKN